MARPSAATATLCFALLLSVHLSSSADPPAASPPGSPPTAASPPPSGISSPPAPPPDTSSPPAPPPDASGPSPDTPPTPSPSPSPSPSSPPDADADSPPPAPPSPVAYESGTKKSSSGMSTGTKAGVAFGVIAFVALAATGAFVYKKRKDNVERARYGSAARRDML